MKMRKRMFGRLAALAMVAATATMATPATSGDTDEIATILRLVDAAKNQLVNSNYVISHITVERIVKGQDHTITRTMYANNAYRVIGVGGTGIDDLDLWISDPNGAQIDYDVALDEFPIVDVPRSVAGTYSMRFRYVTTEAGFNEEDERYFAAVVAFLRRN